MVKETPGKAIKQLKQERTLAKTAFTKQANYLSRAAKSMSYKRSSASSVHWLGMSVMQMMSTGLAYWRIMKLELMRTKKSTSHQEDELEKTMEECVTRPNRSNLTPGKSMVMRR
ncbi:hypothetical protein PAMP_014698 [Pampus punctatissimus]